VKYSKHNIQQNNQTKKKKKLGVSGPLERSGTVQCMRSIRAPSAAADCKHDAFIGHVVGGVA